MHMIVSSVNIVFTKKLIYKNGLLGLQRFNLCDRIVRPAEVQSLRQDWRAGLVALAPERKKMFGFQINLSVWSSGPNRRIN